MVEIKEIVKLFDGYQALGGVSFSIENGSVFGLVGSNGAGKSTLLRVLAGVYKPDGGAAYIDGEEPFENVAVKEKTAFVSDYPYFYPGTTMEGMAYYYKCVYPQWDDSEYARLKSIFPINPRQKISTMSKGMQRQTAIILALSHKPQLILFDEIFDGLDPVIRELLKRVLISYVSENNASVVIATHNLRELEGFCDHIGLLHQGGILLQKDIDGDSVGMFRVQFVVSEDEFEKVRPELKIVKETRQGKMIQLTAKGTQQEITEIINRAQPQYFEALPLTLEELFISEMEEAGYDIDKFFC